MYTVTFYAVNYIPYIIKRHVSYLISVLKLLGLLQKLDTTLMKVEIIYKITVTRKLFSKI